MGSKMDAQRRAEIVLALELKLQLQLLIARRKPPRRMTNVPWWWVWPCVPPARRLEYGHTNRLMQDMRVEAVFVTISLAFRRNSASNPACPHGRLAKKTVQNTTFYPHYSDGNTHIKQHRSKGVQANWSPCANKHCITQYEQSFRHNKHTHTNQ